ncbi:MAG: sulfate ABC transporter permease subunit CysT [Coriobacteriaceae bacterium]|nr:sulfate ABC transporter permease subunit CysT [Coriobacteriaceae bacterium]
MSNQKASTRSHARANRVIPGFGISFGITVTLLCIIVLIPLGFLIWSTLNLTFEDFIKTITSSRALASYAVSLSCALIATLINAVMGTVLAWVLVRYSFPGKRILDGLIELPFALPTAIAGLSLTALTVDTGWVGSIFANWGIDIAYTRIGIIIALTFVGFPFVVRSVQPVLEKIDYQTEEASEMLGAGRIRTFFSLLLPEIRPALLAGAGLSFARCLGEYGSVIFIAGNTPFQTEITPLLIMSQLQEYDYAEATALALVLLIVSFVVLFAMNAVQTRASRKTQG